MHAGKHNLRSLSSPLLTVMFLPLCHAGCLWDVNAFCSCDSAGNGGWALIHPCVSVLGTCFFCLSILADKPFPRGMLWMATLIQTKLFHLLQWQFKPTSQTYKAAGLEGSSVLMAADEEDVLPGMCKPDTCRLCLTCGCSDCTLHCFDAGVLCSAHTCLMSNMVTDFFL